MASLLLDTTVIVDAINGKRQRHLLLEELLAQRNLLACCGISVTEVYAGMRPHEARLTEARLAGELQNRWRKKGHTLSLPDVTIAAVALTHGLTLLTKNRKDFPMPELALYSLR